MVGTVVVVGSVVVVGRVVVVGAVVIVGEVVVDPVVVVDAHRSGCCRHLTAVLAAPPETRNPAAKMAAVRNSPMSVLN